MSSNWHGVKREINNFGFHVKCHNNVKCARVCASVIEIE